MADMKNVLVAVDLGEGSRRALEQARTLAAHFGASLHLLCVVQDPFSLPWAPEAATETLSTLLARMQAEARAHLETLIPVEDRERFQARFVVRVGKPSDEILAYAKENPIGLIVMGRGGHGSLAAGSAMGSVAEAVVRGATCPTLVVPMRTSRRRLAQHAA